MLSEILRMTMDIETFNSEILRITPMTISIEETYQEYHYAIFLDRDKLKQQCTQKECNSKYSWGTNK